VRSVAPPPGRPGTLPLAGQIEVIAVDQSKHAASPGEAFDAGNLHTPDFQRLVLFGHDVRIGGVAGFEAHAVDSGEQKIDR